MKTEFDFDGARCEVRLTGELDHHAAKSAIAEMCARIDRTMPSRLILDMEGVTFMDSSGIALIICGYKRMKAIGGSFMLSGTPDFAVKILNAAGLMKFVPLAPEKSDT